MSGPTQAQVVSFTKTRALFPRRNTDRAEDDKNASRADENVKDILTAGVSYGHLKVRPHLENGTPAHTVKKFRIVNRYDLSQEFPVLTLRRTAFKSAIDELLRILQKKSNNIRYSGVSVLR